MTRQEFIRTVIYKYSDCRVETYKNVIYFEKRNKLEQRHGKQADYSHDSRITKWFEFKNKDYGENLDYMPKRLWE